MNIVKTCTKPFISGGLLVILLSINISAWSQPNVKVLPYQDKNQPVEARIADLLSQMTVEEKAMQLTNTYAQFLTDMPEFKGRYQLTPNGMGGLNYERFGTNPTPVDAALQINQLQKLFAENTRLGIPPIIHAEGLHGVCSNGFTIFPQAIGMASTWNPLLISEMAKVISTEARTIGIRQFLSPVLNVARDPRWGRTEETFGEDPYLISRMGVAFCKPVEESGIITTPKHFELNFTDGGRESNEAHLSERVMHEIYFPAYKAVFKEAGSQSLMLAYNAIDGQPCSTNKWLVTDMLRGKLDFKGFTVTDYTGLDKIELRHHTATSREEIAAQAINAGLDRELPDPTFFVQPLINAVKKGMVTTATLDTSVARVLRAKFKLGLFDDRYVNDANVKANVDTEEHRELAHKLALETMVLLKNANNNLPFAKNIKSLALIGAHADEAQTGGYSGWGVKTVSPLEGLQNKAKDNNFRVIHTKASWLTYNELSAIQASYLFYKNAKGELVPGVEATYFNNTNLTGELEKMKVEKNIAFLSKTLMEEVHLSGGQLSPFSAKWKGCFKAPYNYKGKLGIRASGGVRLKVDGKTIIDRWEDGTIRRNIEPMVEFTFSKGKVYDFEIEYYSYEHGIKEVFFGWDAIPFEETAEGKALRTAKAADAIVFVANISEGEGSDRGLLNLSPSQEKMIKLLAAEKKPFAVVLVGGGVITMTNWIDEVPSLLEAWYPGEEGGNAIADVLFGDYNPGGKLPINFPVHESQLPIYYNQKPAGRGYYDYNNMTGFPLFPFGYGLSYTTFEYSNLCLSSQEIKADQSIDIFVDVKNTGKVKGDEIVQLYLRDEYASVSRPLKELKGFQRISIAAGETKSVKLTLTPEELMMLNKEMKWVVEPGVFTVMIGASCEDIRLKSTFEVIEQ